MRLRFTIRELLCLVVVVALAVAWWVDHRAIGVQRDEAQAMVKQLQGKTTVNPPYELIKAINPLTLRTPELLFRPVLASSLIDGRS